MKQVKPLFDKEFCMNRIAIEVSDDVTLCYNLKLEKMKTGISEESFKSAARNYNVKLN
jgi:hypothetical protein